MIDTSNLLNQTISSLATPTTFGPAPQGPPPGAIIFNPVQRVPPGAIVFNPTSGKKIDRRTPIQKRKEELAKFGSLIDLAGNVASLVPGLQPLRYAGDLVNLIT